MSLERKHLLTKLSILCIAAVYTAELRQDSIGLSLRATRRVASSERSRVRARTNAHSCTGCRIARAVIALLHGTRCELRERLGLSSDRLPEHCRSTFPCGVYISAEALRLLHLACEHYVYDVRAGNLCQPRLPGYMTVDNDGTPDPDYHPSDADDTSDAD